LIPCLDKKFFSFLDNFNGYNQIQIAPEDQEKNTFTCPWGTFSYRVLLFGICNAPATFQQDILGIFFDLVNESLDIYMDDFTPYGDTFDMALANLEKVLKHCKETHIYLSTKKFHMMMDEGVVLTHYISSVGIHVDHAKIKVILKIPPPKLEKEVRSLLGKTGYYHCFIENYSRITSPLFALLSKDTKFIWNDKFQTALTNLKKRLFEAPILRGPDWTFPFHISLDSLDTAIGVVLGQQEE
jgi:hypothetical protein